MMTEIRLLILFFLLFTIAIAIVCYPVLKKRSLFQLSIAFFLTMGASAGYWLWGSWLPYTTFTHQQALLSTIKNPQELIDKIKTRLNQEPNSARGWFLLGRLYSSQNQWGAALDAFDHAHRLEPDNEQMTVNYAQGLWQNNYQKFNPEIRQILQTILETNANQPDAISMLAMDAFQEGAYTQAIKYWTHLLTLVPPDSEDAKAIRKAIAKARNKL